MKSIAPCKDCQFRTIGCHSKCPKYIDFKQKKDAEHKMQREDQEYWDYKSHKLMANKNIRTRYR